MATIRQLLNPRGIGVAQLPSSSPYTEVRVDGPQTLKLSFDESTVESPTKLTGPTTIQKAKNLKRSAAHWARGGFKRIKQLFRNHRWKICFNCPSGMYRKVKGAHRCTNAGCGCFLQAKVRLNAPPGVSNCPLNYWPIITAEGKEDWTKVSPELYALVFDENQSVGNNS